MSADGPEEDIKPTSRDPKDVDFSDGKVVHRSRRHRGLVPAVEIQKGRIAIGLTSDGRIKSGKLAGLSMGGAIWVLSWPILVESFLNSLVGLTDTVLAAALPNGEAATDAIGGASYIMWFIGLTIMAIGIGATALISRAVGGGKLAVANAALGQTVLLALILGTVVGSGIFVVASPVPHRRV